jgi:uncharacterized RDD family membrane protein YckC
MKCPKCGYIGFEDANRCRNCGYDFSLVVSGTEPVSAAGDLEIRQDPRGRARRRRIGSGVATDPDRPGPALSEADLPLFDDAPFEPRPGRPAAPSRPPIAVRRSTPPAPRMRPRPLLARDPEIGELDLEPETSPEPASEDSRQRKQAAEAGCPSAGAGARVIAGLIDLLLVLGLDIAVVYFTLRLCRLVFAEIGLLPVPPLAAFFLLLNGGYLVVFTATGGQTIGKMATGIKVVDESGASVVFSQALVRTLAYVASILPVGLGLVPVLFGQDRRALHDRLTNTRVISVSS